jgi:hypothetical protein
MGTVLAILFVVALIAGAVWTSRTDDGSTTNGDNRAAATRYGPGA